MPFIPGDQDCPHCQGTGKRADLAAEGRVWKAVRKVAKLSMREVAQLIGTSHVYIGEIERGATKCSPRVAELLTCVYSPPDENLEHGKLKIAVLRGLMGPREARNEVGRPRQEVTEIGTWLTARMQEEEANAPHRIPTQAG